MTKVEFYLKQLHFRMKTWKWWPSHNIGTYGGDGGDNGISGGGLGSRQRAGNRRSFLGKWATTLMSRAFDFCSRLQSVRNFCFLRSSQFEHIRRWRIVGDAPCDLGMRSGEWGEEGRKMGSASLLSSFSFLSIMLFFTAPLFACFSLYASNLASGPSVAAQ